MSKRSAILITAFNEENSIGKLLSSIKDLYDDEYDVYVVDDCSSDRTPAIAKEHGAKVISHISNMGQGLAVETGFRVLLDEDYDFVIHMDGDGQHDPKDISKYIAKFKETSADIVQGSRILGSNYKEAPFFRKTFLKPLTLVINKLTGYEFTDSMCGMRGYRLDSLKNASYIFDEMIETTYRAAEKWIRFSKAGFKVSEVPINLLPRKHGFSHKGFFRYGWGIFVAILRAKFDIYKKEAKK